MGKRDALKALSRKEALKNFSYSAKQKVLRLTLLPVFLLLSCLAHNLETQSDPNHTVPVAPRELVFMISRLTDCYNRRQSYFHRFYKFQLTGRRSLFWQDCDQLVSLV
eukprot:g1890.t1